MTEKEYRQEEVDQVLSGEPLIYERNPDTGEIRSYERTPEPKPYRNEMAEVVEILQRIESKLQYICEVGVSKSDTTPYSVWKEYNK